ncbi:MAG: hypothetical protein M9918_24635 [Anaerolineae bacterium]|nr:hypothetical protein [Anaerolineae bacterium]
MSYSTGEARILEIIRLHADYDTTNSDRQDWKILHSGKSDRYAILRPGAWSNTANGLGGAFLRNWTTVVEVWVPYRDDTRPLTLQAAVNDLLAHLEKYPTLNSLTSVQDAMIAGGNEMQERELNNGSLWAVWELNCEWHEETAVTFAE